MSDFRAYRRSGNGPDRAAPPGLAVSTGSALPAVALVGSLMAISMAGLAEDDWSSWQTGDDQLAQEQYSDPWGTEYENPFSDHDPEADDGPDRFRVYDRGGRSTGRMERDPVGEGRYTLYDDRGRMTGRVEESPGLDDSYLVYDRRGRREKEIRRSLLADGQYEVYDKRGRRIGRIEESPIVEGQFDIYDEKGRRIGRVESD